MHNRFKKVINNLKIITWKEKADIADKEEFERFSDAVDVDRMRLPGVAKKNTDFDKFSTDTPSRDAAFWAESALANWYLPPSTE